jgi:hypothetical protein
MEKEIDYNDQGNFELLENDPDPKKAPEIEPEKLPGEDPGVAPEPTPGKEDGDDDDDDDTPFLEPSIGDDPDEMDKKATIF